MNNRLKAAAVQSLIEVLETSIAELKLVYLTLRTGTYDSFPAQTVDFELPSLIAKAILEIGKNEPVVDSDTRDAIEALTWIANKMPKTQNLN